MSKALRLLIAITTLVTAQAAIAESEAAVMSDYPNTIEQIAAAIEEQYPIAERAHRIAADLREAASDPALAEAADNAAFIEATNAVLWESAHDLHLRLHSDEALQERASASGGRVPRMRRVMAPEGDGEQEVDMANMSLGTTEISSEMLNDETGLITVSSAIFNNRDLFTDTLSNLSGAKNIILDLRTVPGGSMPGVQYFLSQFYGEPTHMVSNVSRDFDEPQELWSFDTPLSGTFAGKNLYVLTSHRTGSGAEATAYALKETGRGVLIGEKTAGAGNAGAFMSVGPGISLFLPIAQTISPVTGEPWEGTGVKPHLTTISDSALQVALSTIDKGLQPGDPGFGQSESDVFAVIDDYVIGLSERDEFSGVVLVAKDGDVVASNAVGDADKDTGREITADTPINLGSANKMFTGVAIAQLVEQGLVDWQGTVGEYLPDYPNETVRDRVTIEQLLTHTSGTVAFSGPEDFRAYREVTTVAGLMDVISDNPLAFEPGTQYEYSNAGPWILGRIIEVVTGEDYYVYIQANVFDPAGMKNSGFFRKDDPDAMFARGYLKPQQGAMQRGPTQQGQPVMVRRSPPGGAPAETPSKESGESHWQVNTEIIGMRGSPSGSAYASASDMLRFTNAMNANQLISADSFKTLLTPRSGKEAKDYGYLFRLDKTNGYRSWGHNGGGPGIQSMFMHIPALGYTIIVLSNYGEAARPVSEQLQTLLTASASD